MGFKTITIDQKAYDLLLSLKLPGDSFSKVIRRHVRGPANTCGDMLDRIWENPPPNVSDEMIDQVVKHRGRRSNRK